MAEQIISSLLTDDPGIFRDRIAEFMQEPVHVLVKSRIFPDQFVESIGFRGGVAPPIPHPGDFQPFPERRVFLIDRRH